MTFPNLLSSISDEIIYLLLLISPFWVFLKSIQFFPVPHLPPPSSLTLINCTPLNKQIVHRAAKINTLHQGQQGSGQVGCPISSSYPYTPPNCGQIGLLWVRASQKVFLNECLKEGRTERVTGKEQRRVGR